MFLGEISGHLGVQSHCVQELGPQSHQVGGQPGKILADLLSYLLWVVEHLQREKSVCQKPSSIILLQPFQLGPLPNVLPCYPLPSVL